MDVPQRLGPAGPTAASPPPSARPPLVMAAVAALILGLVALGGNTGARIAPSTTEEIEAAADADAEATARGFVTALQDGDVSAAGALVAVGATIELPGLPLASSVNVEDHDGVAATLAFYAALVDIEVGDCRRADSAVTASAVTCDSVVDSSFAQAGNVAGRVVPLTFAVGDGRIAAIERAPEGAPELTDFCYWIEREAAQEGLFDAECSPIVDAGLAEAQSRVAAEFVAAGRPRSGAVYRNGRVQVALLRYFMAEQNGLGDAARFATPAGPARGYPGLLGYGANPTVDSFLGWSDVAYDVTLGRCYVDGSLAPDRFGLDCPQATWSGPLLELLDLDPLPHHVAFSIEGSQITGVTGATHPRLFSSFTKTCTATRATDPDAAARVFGDGCRPLYSPEGARSLLHLLANVAA